MWIYVKFLRVTLRLKFMSWHKFAERKKEGEREEREREMSNVKVLH